MFKLPLIGLMLGASLLAGCVVVGQDSGAFQHLSVTDNGDVIVHALDGSDARITAAGELAIAGKSVAVTPTQRPLLTTYHADALVLHDDAIATGKAGAGLGMHALGTVAKGLASGDPDSIDKKLQPQADKVEALGDKVCKDLAALYATQGRLVSALPAFKPYATIKPQEVSDCSK